MPTYALLPRDPAHVVPDGELALPIFLDAQLARDYRERLGWTGDCEVAKLPALEVLRTMIRAHNEGVSRVDIKALDGGRIDRLELTLDDPWQAFADFVHFYQGRFVRHRSIAISADGFSDPRLHHERPQTLAAPAEAISEHDSVVLDLAAAQLLSQAGSLELAKHALDIVAELEERLRERADTVGEEPPQT